MYPNEDVLPGEALFEVKRKDGQHVFAVYEDMVWVYVDPEQVKGVKGEFAVGGFKRSKGVTEEYMRLTFVPEVSLMLLNTFMIQRVIQKQVMW